MNISRLNAGRLAALLVLATTSLRASAEERPAAPVNPVPVATYDAEDDVTTVSTPPVKLKASPSLSVYAFYSYAGKDPKAPNGIRFLVAEVHETQIWAEGEHISLQTGGTTKEYKSDMQSKARKSGGFLEMATVLLPVAEFSALANSDAIGFKVGTTSDTVEKEWLEPLRKLAAAVGDK